MNSVLVIPAGSVQPFQSCGMVLVFGDSIREQDERFSVRVTAENSEDEVSTASFSITIEDDGDCKYCSRTQLLTYRMMSPSSL